MGASWHKSSELRWLLDRRTPTASPATEQAQRVLRWLDQRVVPRLDDEHRRAYQRARRIHGRPAQVRVRGFGMCVDMRGAGDDAYGHHRLRAVVRDVVVPLIAEGVLDSGTAHHLQQSLRGEFADLCREVERALVTSRRSSAG